MTDREQKKPLYDVGYGKPPRQTRFQAGQSGNPKGRPKGVQNFAAAIEKELNTRIPVKENGQQKVISKRVAVAKQLINKAVGGDLKAIQPLISVTSQHERQAIGDGLGGRIAPLAAPEDTHVIASILQRIRAAAGVPPAPAATEAASETDEESALSTPKADAIAGESMAEGEDQ